MRNSVIATLKDAAPAILEGRVSGIAGVSIRKTARIVKHLKANPGCHTAAELGKIVHWGAQNTRVALGAIGVQGVRGKGYEWKVSKTQGDSNEN
jgi:hypothetical protein